MFALSLKANEKLAVQNKDLGTYRIKETKHGVDRIVVAVLRVGKYVLRSG
jgi:hypothetical protein